MKGLIERAYAGNRQAVMELYEKYRKGATSICMGSYEDAEQANTAVVQAFQNTWGYLFNNCIKSEEEFQTTLYKQAAILCRRNFMKRGMKGLPIPQNKNFLVAKWKETSLADASPLENLLAMLPGINRYIFVLHCIAGFDEKMIASITGYKSDVVEAALEAEVQNTAKALEQLNKEAGITVDLEKEIQQYRETVDLPEKYQQQIVANIYFLVKPYEKKKMVRNVLYAAGAVAVVAVLCMIGVSARNKNSEVLFTETEEGSVTQSDEQAGEGTAGEESGQDAGEDTLQNEENTQEDAEDFVFTEGQSYYADIVIDGYGTVTVELDYETAPITVENFVFLAEEGFYDGLTFHRIMEGFMMQGGDPNGNGSGGSDETIVGEFSDNGYDNDLSHTRGAISMARATAYDSASSQFFIVHEDSTFLDGQYAAFGYVTEGMDIVDAICTEAEPTDDNGTIPAEEQPVITTIDIRTESDDAGES